MKLQLFFKGLFTQGANHKHVARYALEPLSPSVSLEGTTVNPLALRGLFIS